MWFCRSNATTPLNQQCSKPPNRIGVTNERKLSNRRQSLSIVKFFFWLVRTWTNCSTLTPKLTSLSSVYRLPEWKNRYSFTVKSLTISQTGYTTTKKEFLSIVTKFEGFRSILLEQKSQVETDDQNHTVKTITTDCVIQRRLILEEYSLKPIFIKEERNIVANDFDRLSMLLCSPNQPNEKSDNHEKYQTSVRWLISRMIWSRQGRLAKARMHAFI